MGRIQTYAWCCDKCGFVWLGRRNPKTGKQGLPEQCSNKKCRSRLWNSGVKEVKMIGGAFGGAPEFSGQVFRHLRKKMHASQAKFGSIIGVTGRQVANIESGRSKPSDRTLSTFNALYARHMEKPNV